MRTTRRISIRRERSRFSARLDRPDLCGALVDRDHRQLALRLGRQAAEVIHDRLPFLDLADRAVRRNGGDTALVRRTRRRQQVGCRASRVVECFPLTLPPLRSRPDDIPLLVWHIIGRKQNRLGRRIERVPERLMRAFRAYTWPGNIRELENVIERALILSTGPTLASDPLLMTVRLSASSQATGSLSDVERQHILDVLEQCGWKVAGKGHAAERLGLNRSTLLSRMKKLGIRRPAPES